MRRSIMLEPEPRVVPTSAWEWKVPLILLLTGIVVSVTGAYMVDDIRGAAFELYFIAVMLAVELPLMIVAMLATATVVGVSYGVLKTPILKMAAIIIVTLTLLQLCVWAEVPLVGILIAVPVVFYLFANFFDQNAY